MKLVNVVFAKLAADALRREGRIKEAQMLVKSAGVLDWLKGLFGSSQAAAGEAPVKPPAQLAQQRTPPPAPVGPVGPGGGTQKFQSPNQFGRYIGANTPRLMEEQRFTPQPVMPPAAAAPAQARRPIVPPGGRLPPTMLRNMVNL